MRAWGMAVDIRELRDHGSSNPWEGFRMCQIQRALLVSLTRRAWWSSPAAWLGGWLPFLTGLSIRDTLTLPDTHVFGVTREAPPP